MTDTWLDIEMRCKSCRKIKEESWFSDYNKSTCKDCLRERNRKWHKDHLDEVRAKKLQNYHKIKNDPNYRENRSAYYKEWYKKNGRSRGGNYKESIYGWKKENPEKVTAHRILNDAIRIGIVKRPNTCSRCNRSGCRILGHHNLYNRPLEVVWLCSSCHKIIHQS